MGHLSGMSFARNDALPSLPTRIQLYPRGQFFPQFAHLSSNQISPFSRRSIFYRSIGHGWISTGWNDFSRNTIFGNANTRVRVGIRVFQIEKGKRKRGPLSNRHAVVKDTQELRQERASNWKTSFSTFPLPLSSCFTLVASTHERFMGRVKDTRSVHRQFYNEITGGARRRFYMLNGIPPRYPVVHLRSATETTNFVPSLPLSIEGTSFSQVLVPFIDLISRKTGWGGPSPPLLFDGPRWFVKAEG